MIYNINIYCIKNFIKYYPYYLWNIDYLIKYNKIIDFKFLNKLVNNRIRVINKFPDKSKRKINNICNINNYLKNPWDWGWIIKNIDPEFNIEKYLSLDLIKKYKNILNYIKLSENQNITEEFILNHPYKYWDIIILIENNKITNFNALSKFKYIDEYIIYSFLNKPWDWEWLLENTDIKLEEYISLNLIEKYSYKLDYFDLSLRSDISEDIILKYPYQNWNIEYLIENNKITDFNALTKFKNINQEIIDKYPNKSWDQEWLFKNKVKKYNLFEDIEYLIKLKNINQEWIIENTNIRIEKYISIEIIKKYLYKWDYWELSKNPNLTEEVILKYPYQNWNINYLIKNNKITNFNALSKFKYIDEDIIDNYPNKLWNWKWILQNTDISIEIYMPLYLIKKYLYKLDFSRLSYNSNLTEKYILKYPYQNWDIKYLIENNKITNFNALSKFKNINQDIVCKYLNKQWDWEWMIKNTNICRKLH